MIWRHTFIVISLNIVIISQISSTGSQTEEQRAQALYVSECAARATRAAGGPLSGHARPVGLPPPGEHAPPRAGPLSRKQRAGPT